MTKLSVTNTHTWVWLSVVCLLLVYMLQDSETVTGFGGVGVFVTGPYLSCLSFFKFSLNQITQCSPLCHSAGGWGGSTTRQRLTSVILHAS